MSRLSLLGALAASLVLSACPQSPATGTPDAGGGEVDGGAVDGGERGAATHFQVVPGSGTLTGGTLRMDAVVGLPVPPPARDADGQLVPHAPTDP